MDTATKFQLLKQSLADELNVLVDEIDFQNDFQNTGWAFNDDNGWWEHDGSGSSMFKELPNDDLLPEIREACHCTTPIKWNHLIHHKTTNRLFVVGNVCIRRLGIDMRKLCIDCNAYKSVHTARCASCRVKCALHNEFHADNRYCGDKTYRTCPDCGDRNRAHTKYCADCRVKCSVCKVFHDDNNRCKSFWKEPIPKARLVSKSMTDIISFGRYKGNSYDWIKANDDQYLHWLVRAKVQGHEWLSNHI